MTPTPVRYPETAEGQSDNASMTTLPRLPKTLPNRAKRPTTRRASTDVLSTLRDMPRNNPRPSRPLRATAVAA